MDPRVGYLAVSLLTFSAVNALHASVTQDCSAHMPRSTPNESFELVQGGMAVHKETGLKWARCLVGQEWEDGSCVGSPKVVRFFPQAADVAEDSNYGGYEDWRVPNIKELESILEYACRDPAFNLEVFDAQPAQSVLWSSTPNETGDGEMNIWTIDARTNIVGNMPMDIRPYSGYPEYHFTHVRLVRDPE
ncbi:hypothetical protein J2T60_001772 [Natronospira proteinivora]|uniref:Lcl C-terminal domain-containing protein n=2 Tax=Natronospira proteinivora TaxID=1807133 RepID=A0ABT1G8Y7_9GAMM|nr:hypothetical protein [Natronospira proteinivora]